MSKPFRMFAGGRIDLGKAWMSWIHLDDVVGLFLYCLDTEAAVGVYNATAPNPVSNVEFSKTLGSVLKRPSFFYVPAIMLRLAKGEFAQVITASIRARPLRTLALGYEFKFPQLRDALLDLEGKA
jgi:NAD dependent epimerase/dehydratase family enzyme